MSLCLWGWVLSSVCTQSMATAGLPPIPGVLGSLATFPGTGQLHMGGNLLQWDIFQEMSGVYPFTWVLSET